VNDVSILHGANRPAQRGLRRNVSGHQPTSRAAESSVSEESNRTTEPLTHNRRSHSEHLAHPRTTLRPFVANHHNIACLDLLRGHRCHRVFFGFEHARRPAMLPSFVPADLGPTSFWGKITLENHQPTSSLQRLGERSDHFLPGSLNRALGLGPNREAGYSLRRRMQVFS